MNPSEDYKDAAPDGTFVVTATNKSSFLHRTNCEREGRQDGMRINTAQRPRPGRRRLSMRHLSPSLIQIILFVNVVLLVLCMPAEAVEHAGSHNRAIKGHFVDGRIMFDHNPIPLPALHRRDDPASTDTVSSTAAAEASVASTSASSTTTTSLPRAFDAGFGTNYTQPSCPTFLRSMVNNDTFNACVPFSLLLQNSMSFFDASRSLSTITAVLNASCSVPFPTCSALMSSFALTLRSSTACQDDYSAENPEVRQAYAGLLAYDVSYNASCLKNPPGSDADAQQDNQNYCFANAVTNRSSPTDSYIYYMPMGTPLPAGTIPTCDRCLAATMSVYAAAASNKSQPLNLDYVDSATLVNEMCGPAFVNTSVPNAGSSSGGAGGGKKSSAAPASRTQGALWSGPLVGAAAAAAAALVALL